MAAAPPNRLASFASALALLAPAVARAAIGVSVDPALDRRPVSPLIYGVNYGNIADFGATPYTIRRWGGNATTRYSWTEDTHNSGSDWYYISTPSNHPNPALLPNGSEADLFVGATRGAGADVLMTVPLIGWSPKDRVKRWGFSVAKYGAQVDTECGGSGGAPWCAADAGNGVKPGNIPVTGNDPADTSVPIGPSYVGDWITHLTGQFGAAAAGGVRYYDLDNEPGLWNSTHRDVHPQALTYDELWTRTFAYASELKLRDPGAKVLGPVSWGWCEYFWSPADGCGPGADRTAHGGLDLVAWYLQQVEAHRVATGTRLVDLLDIHYYPQAGTALNDDESASKAALRLRTLKSLYDPAYVDESWINQPVRLIPRMRAIIDARCPGTGLAITEYNFGGDTGISSALAQAEALAIFGREGVDLATRWVAPAAGTRCADALRLYLNYDGAGARVSGTSVRATSAKVDSVGAYAIQADDGKLFVLLFNKHVAGETAQLTVAAGGDRVIGLWRFTAGAGLASAGSSSLASGAATLALPARSATLAVIASPLTAALDTPSGRGLALRMTPNPSTGPATIEFTLPRPATATVALYDIAGRCVRRLAGGDFPAGSQRLAWDGLDDRGHAVPAGNYRVRIAALGRVESKSLVRLR